MLRKKNVYYIPRAISLFLLPSLLYTHTHSLSLCRGIAKQPTNILKRNYKKISNNPKEGWKQEQRKFLRGEKN